MSIGKWLTYNFAVGKADINGEDWGDIFAKSLGGEHLSSPVGLADVVCDGNAWSVKSVKQAKPHTCTSIRIISGRNSPDYSYGIENPHDDIQKTGEAVLSIWNQRVNIALDNFDALRTAILIRENNSLQFALFEFDTAQYAPVNFVWSVNKNGNFEGHCKTSGAHYFTWQPHGAQFTIKYTVPVSAIRFQLRRPATLDFEKTMDQIGYDDSWVTFTEQTKPS